MEFIDKISFTTKEDAEAYISMVARPSNWISDSECYIYLKNGYANEINSLMPSNYKWFVTAETKPSVNRNRKVLSHYYLYVNYCITTIFYKNADELMYQVRTEYGGPKTSKSISEVVEKRYNTINIDQLVKDVEKLKTEKNKFIVDEIGRSTEYILTLKKLL